MKIIYSNDKAILLGTGVELQPVAKALWRASRKGRTDFIPLYEETPKFNTLKSYGLDLTDGIVLTAEDLIREIYRIGD